MSKKSFILLGVVSALLIGAIWLSYSQNKTDIDENTLFTAAKTPGAEATPEPVEPDFDAGAYGEGESGSLEASAGTDYFARFRSERNEVRQKELAYLDEIIASPDTDDETSTEAQARKLELVGNMEKEFLIESLVMAKGFDDVAATFGAGSINVIVDAPTLSDAEAARILEIVKRETGASARDVKIVAGAR